jgi:CheY-like chemotaxis protein
MLKKMKALIDSITKSSEDVLARFEAIDSGVRTVSEHGQNIRAAMEEQEVGGRQILESVGRLRELSITVNEGTGEVSSSMDALMERASEFMNITGQVLKGMNEIVSGAMGEIKTAVTHVNEMSEENSTNFTDLKEETEKFKVSTSYEKKKILVVDDDATTLTAARGMLDSSYDVVTTNSGKDALALFFRGLVPDLILLDLKMPGMDGWVTYERIKAISNLHHVPIAIFSSSDNPEDKERAQQMGAVDFIKKPANRSELLKRTQSLIRK